MQNYVTIDNTRLVLLREKYTNSIVPNTIESLLNFTEIQKMEMQEFMELTGKFDDMIECKNKLAMYKKLKLKFDKYTTEIDSSGTTQIINNIKLVDNTHKANEQPKDELVN